MQVFLFLDFADYFRAVPCSSHWFLPRPFDSVCASEWGLHLPKLNSWCFELLPVVPHHTETRIWDDRLLEEKRDFSKSLTFRHHEGTKCSDFLIFLEVVRCKVERVSDTHYPIRVAKNRLSVVYSLVGF